MRKLDAVSLLNNSYDVVEAKKVVDQFLVDKSRSQFESMTGCEFSRWTYPYEIVFRSDEEIDGFVEVIAKDKIEGSAALEQKTWNLSKNELWD